MEPGDRVAKETVSDRLIYHWIHDQKDVSIWGIAELDTPLQDDRIRKTLYCNYNRIHMKPETAKQFLKKIQG